MKNKKLLLLTVLLITFLSFWYLVLPKNSSISVPIFILIQAYLFFKVTRLRQVWYVFIPIMILSIAIFINSNPIWRMPIFIVMFFLYSFIGLFLSNKLNLKDNIFNFLKDIGINILSVTDYATLPIKWFSEIFKEKSEMVKKIIYALIISIPVIVFLTFVLSQVDMVFAHGVNGVLNGIFKIIDLKIINKIIISLVIAIYIFGIIYGIINSEIKEKIKKEQKLIKFDFFTINIVLVIVLIIYTIFIVIQIKYLFAQGDLPYGLTYSEYARKGFFELLFLSSINIGVIVFISYFSKNSKVNKLISNYLCTITIILLVSSFYRMNLYNVDFGLTRLRLYVFGFLIFEMIGLIVTYFYINKQNFNIIFVYFVLCITYFTLLVIVPTDRFVAKNQIDRYMNGEKLDIEYITSLSLDAAGELERLIDDSEYSYRIYDFFESKLKEYDNKGWQSYNLSVEKARQIHEDNMNNYIKRSRVLNDE